MTLTGNPWTLYGNVFDALGLSPVARDFALGRLPLPSLTETVPFPAAGFPPALVPIWLRPTGLEYFGYWKHFFTSRHVSVVSTAAEDGFLVVEVARSVEQFFAYECLRQLAIWDGVRPAIERFARDTGVDLVELERIFRDLGDDPDVVFKRPPLNRDDLPWIAVRRSGETYRGDFPSPAMVPDADVLRATCTLEYTPELLAKFAALPTAPPWFRSTDQPALFQELLAAKDYQGAWMTLNSSGWYFVQAKGALAMLADAAGSKELGVLAEAWIGEPHDGVPGY
jgi:hypothetical protein